MREKIPEIMIKIGEKTYVTNHQEEVKIARETIDQNMIEQSSIYDWYAALCVMTDEIVGICKLELEVLEAQLYEEHKKELISIGIKVTDKSVDSKVKQDDRYITAVLALLEAKKNHGIFNAITRSFEHRREMLINLGAKFRREMDGALVTKKEEEKDLTYR